MVQSSVEHSLFPALLRILCMLESLISAETIQYLQFHPSVMFPIRTDFGIPNTVMVALEHGPWLSNPAHTSLGDGLLCISPYPVIDM